MPGGHHTTRVRSSIAYVMLSSMARRVPHRRQDRARAVARSIATVGLLAGCLVGAGIGIGTDTRAAGSVPPTSASKGCTSTPAPSTIIADTPWPQLRYDLSALSQITDGAGVIVAVIDSGVDAAHPQLASAVRSGKDMLERGGDGRTDCVGHGTAVASIIAARPVAGSGLRGLAPAVSILPVRVNERVDANAAPSGEGAPLGDGALLDDGALHDDGEVADLAAGILAAVASRPRPTVINLSISTRTDNAALRGAVKAALEADIVVVAAVGNQHNRGDPTPYPASYEGVVGVGAIAPDGLRVPTSQVGSYVDIVAPGGGVIGAAPRRGHASYQGTSFASPFVAATAALIRARWPQLDRAGVVRRLLATTDPAAGARPSAEYGYGVLNPMRALTEVVEPAPPSTAPARPAGIAPGHGFTHGQQQSGPTSLALGTAAILLLAAAAVSAVCAAAPLGRRRGWRPGRLGAGEKRPRPARND